MALHNIKPLKEFRRQLRNGNTPAEGKLWKSLQRSQLGAKFRRQHSVGRYILDFYCVERKLAIELDGELHFNLLASEHDGEREKFLEKHDIRVLRFENVEIFENLEFVLNNIRHHLLT